MTPKVVVILCTARVTLKHLNLFDGIVLQYLKKKPIADFLHYLIIIIIIINNNNNNNDVKSIS